MKFWLSHQPSKDTISISVKNISCMKHSQNLKLMVLSKGVIKDDADADAAADDDDDDDDGDENADNGR